MSVVQVEAQEVALEASSGGLWSEAGYRLVRNPGAIAGAIVVTIFILAALFAPLVAPHNPRDQNLDLIANGCCPGPSTSHLLGVDDLGRDEFSRIV
jgi:peptide/nickel transport system permease protein